ncbi:MAG: TonB-dependent receptor [Chitinophagaceae bacterium]
MRKAFATGTRRKTLPRSNPKKRFFFQSVSLLFILFISVLSLSAQNTRTIKGRVTNIENNALPLVTVSVKGKTTGTSTDSSGRFQISAAAGNVLVFSYVGAESKEVIITAQNTVNVQLNTVGSSLQDVVVVGYGAQKKATLTGAVSSIKSAELVSTKNESVTNMLTGKIAGVRVVQNSSEPGSFSNSFDIRGLGTPLVIIDGIPRDNVARIDPNDIESISVLKDGSAAVYGVRAANGVVLITTKKGKNGTLELNYSGNYGLQVPSGLPNSVDAIGYMTLANERSMNNVNGGRTSFTDADFAPFLNGTKQSTSWYDASIRKAVPQSQHNLSATGGNANTTYYFSLGYGQQQGFLRSGDLNYNKYTVRSNISSKVTKSLTFDLNLNAVIDQKNQPYQDAWWIIRSLWRQLPTQSPYANDNPDYLYNPPLDGTNPVAMMSKDLSGYKTYNNKWFQSSISLHYDVPYVKGLKANALMSYDFYASDNKKFQKQYNQYTYNAATQTYNAIAQQSPNIIRREYYVRPTLLTQLSLNYDHSFGDHNISALALLEQIVRNSDNFAAQKEVSLPVDQLFAGNALNQSIGVDGNLVYKYVNLGLVGRVNYNYRGKYLAEFAFRRDGSSKFGPQSQWGFFPSASVGWRISEESFFKNSSSLSVISNLKLRASYGELGDDASLNYQFITGYRYPASGSYNQQPAGSVFNGAFVNSLQSTGIPNPAISWFTAKTTNIGIDLEAWRGLIGITADIFRRDRTGLLGLRDLSLPSALGAALPQENLNSDRVHGFDLELNHRNTIGQFTYFVKGIFSYTRSMTRYFERAKAGNSYENWRNNNNDRNNNIWWGYDKAGQFQSFDDIKGSPSFIGRSALPGSYAYQDWNGDGQITDLDVHPLRNTGIPLVNYGLTLGGSWKGIDFNALFQGAALTNVSYIEQLQEPLWGGGSGLTQFLDRWHPADPKADPYDPNTKWIPGHYAYTGILSDINSLYNIQNGAYLRLKSLEIGYSIPTDISGRIGIKNARVYVNGYNIFTATAVKYVDPEHPSDTYGYIYPLNKTFNVGINVKF